MQTVRVALGPRSYPVHIGSGLLRRADLVVPALPQARAAIVTNTTVSRLHLEALSAALEAAGVACVRIVVPDGEDHKDWATLDEVIDQLLVHRCDRHKIGRAHV